MLELQEIHTFYGDRHILYGVSLKVPDKSIIALLGRNGMGKTTTLRSIIGFTQPTSGKIIFQGKNIVGLPAYQIAQMGISLVPQGRRIFRSLSVKENLLLGWRKPNGGMVHFDLAGIYSLFPVLKERANHSGDHLSGGEQQMLAIARALMMNPELILLDEPSEGLAPAIINNIGQKISELKNLGLSVLLVEQNLPLALRLADYVYIMNKGKIVYGGTPAELLAEEDIKKRFIAL